MNTFSFTQNIESSNLLFNSDENKSRNGRSSANKKTIRQRKTSDEFQIINDRSLDIDKTIEFTEE